jgi:hypothetical protein
MLSAVIASWLGASPVAAAIAGCILAFFVVTVRFGSPLFEWLEKRRSVALVFGVGSVGSQLVRRLVDQGIPVAATDRNPLCPHKVPLRRLGVTVMAGYETLDQVLEAVRAERTRLLFAVTDEDLANIECAVRLQEIHADRARWAMAPAAAPLNLRVLVRSHLTQFGTLMHAADKWDVETVSALAAPAFAKALAGEKFYGEIPITTTGGREEVVVIAELSLDEGSELVGASVKDRRLHPPTGSCPSYPGSYSWYCDRKRHGARTHPRSRECSNNMIALSFWRFGAKPIAFAAPRRPRTCRWAGRPSSTRSEPSSPDGVTTTHSR